MAFGSVFNLSTLNGSNGFALNGVKAGNYSGFSVSNAGDVNGDGTDDLIIGAWGANPNGDRSGQSYVVFGSTNGFASHFNLSTLNGSNGFALNGVKPGDNSGRSVSSAGDVNGDGTDDLIIGAWPADPNGSYSGQSYVVFGSTNGFASSFNLSSLNGSNGFVLNGINAYDNLGYSVSGAGDVNGDGTDDFIVSASGVDLNGDLNSGQSYVVFGSTNGFGSSFNLTTLNGSNGFALNGINAYDSSGSSVSSAGDVNGDGTDDLIIGARNADPNGSYSGQSYVVFGSTNGFASSFNLSSLNGSNGFALNGINASDSSGRSVSSAGDVNGDGTDDLIVGASSADPNGSRSGQSYVVFGSTNGFASSLNLSSLNGSNGFALNGINTEDVSGRSVSNAGDVNGDGIDDLIIGASLADPTANNSGQSYVVFGSTNGFASSFNLSSLNGSNGFALNGINYRDYSGWSVSSAGDVNGDGTDDVLIGAWCADPNGSRSGQSYVVFGQAPPIIEGDNNNNLLNGTSNNDNIQGLGGNDTLNGLAGKDSLDGGTGSDVLNGGIGNDLYIVDNANDVIQETTIVNTEIDQVESSISYTLGNNLENLTLTGTANLQGTGNNLNNRIIGNSGNNFIHGGSRHDILSGNGGNDTLNGGTGNDTLNGGNGNDIYIIDTIADVVQETNTATSQKDTIQASISYTLGSNLENLILTGNSNTQGNGNSLDNEITGNNANNILNGGFGYDTLSGGLGNDSFRFNSGVAFNSNLAVDRIVDFTSNSDKIVLSKNTFTAITSNPGTGFSNGSEFATVTTYAQAQNSAAVIVYNTTNDRLFYNQNGTASGLGTGGAFAELSGNPNLVASDFTIIA